MNLDMCSRMHRQVGAASLTGLLFALSTTAISIPTDVQTLYDNIVAQGECKNQAATGFYALSDSPGTFSYCQDHLDDYGILYLQGTQGQLADMDIDCDGNQDEEPSSSSSDANDGRCGNSGDTQSDTSFQDTVSAYGQGLSNLNPYIHPYVVFGNSADRGRAGYTTFDPTKYGVQPLSLMAVVCNKQVIFGIWGDENGDDAAKAMVGEASISLATLCFGDSMTGDNGHGDLDVLYLAFRGPDAVPGAEGADWKATSADDFEASLETLGSRLLGRIGEVAAGNGSSSATSSSSTATATATTADTIATTASLSHSASGSASTGACSWSGHCAGTSCSTDDDCSNALVCSSRICASN